MTPRDLSGMSLRLSLGVVDAAHVNELPVGSWLRIVERRVRPDDEREGVYEVDIRLEPGETMDAAWERAEVSMRPGWEHLTVRLDGFLRLTPPYTAAAGQFVETEEVFGQGQTPTEALQDLARHLEEKPS